MPHDVDGYQSLASDYHLIFEDWESSIQRQAVTLTEILHSQCGISPPSSILDCACGIGTQCLGLAQRGFQLSASDISPEAVARARKEASARSLTIQFATADMQDLRMVGGENFDAVICMDNSLPHLLDDSELIAAFRQIRGKLRTGGAFLASIRDYDRLLEERPVVQGPSFYMDDGKRRIVFQVWDWLDARRYTFHLYITREAAEHWETHHFSATYRGLRREQVLDCLREAEFTQASWFMPQDSRYYQPLLIAFAK